MDSARQEFLRRMNSDNGTQVRRSAKANVFTDLFSQKEYSYQLFMTLHPEATDITPEDIDVITLANNIMNVRYNDLGLLVGDRFILLAEAQSTWSVNILVRLLLYLSESYNNYIFSHELDVYSSRPLELPIPEFYVIYTGKAPHKDTICLTEEMAASLLA